MKQGIDVSVHNGDVDFDKLRGKIDFAMIRLGYTRFGQLVMDKKFQDNLEGFKKIKVPIGLYVYSYDTSEEEARRSALSVVEVLQSPKANIRIELPVFYDFEEVSRARSDLRIANTEICFTFLDSLCEAGIPTGLYAFTSMMANYIDMAQLAGFNRWVAHWDVETPGVQPWDIHQYKVGKIDGVNTDVDLNRCSDRWLMDHLDLGRVPTRDPKEDIWLQLEDIQRAVEKIKEVLT